MNVCLFFHPRSQFRSSVVSGAWDVLFSLRPSRCILDYMSFLLVSRWSGVVPSLIVLCMQSFSFHSLCCGHPLCTGPLFFIFSETQRHRSVQNEYLHSLIRWPLRLLLGTNKDFRKIYYSWQQDKCLSLMNCIVSEFTSSVCFLQSQGNVGE